MIMSSDVLTLPPVQNRFASLPSDFYRRVQPQGLTQARLVHVNAALAARCGLDPDVLSSQAFLDMAAGNAGLPDGITLAAVYSGHQFGVWAGQLGDGRALLLGETVGPAGPLEWQVKGAGLTPFSRMGDGRAVLRSSIREYLASAAMQGLGIPTTEALSLAASNDPVRRETLETAAIVLRIAPSFIRFGSFEHWASLKRVDHLATLCDFVITHYYPELKALPTQEARAAALFTEVVRRSAELVAAWQSVGFCHGVLNTDNMSILGLTLDYGPFAFMDGFNVHHICNHSDQAGRYAWDAQPSVFHWNLVRLANALLPLTQDQAPLVDALQRFEPQFRTGIEQRMAAKLGLQTWREADHELVNALWSVMHAQRADFTLTFRLLGNVPDQADPAADQAWLQRFSDPTPARDWLQRYRQRLAEQTLPEAERAQRMHAVNPLYILRNHLAEGAIQQAKQRNDNEVRRLMDVLQDPYTERAGYEAYAEPAPDWASTLSISCSS